MTFCNECQVNQASILETAVAFQKSRLTPRRLWFFIVLGVCEAIWLVLFAFKPISYTSITLSIVIGILTVGITVLACYKASVKQMVKMETERIAMLHEGEARTVSIQLNETGIAYSSTGLDRSIQYADVLRVVQSKNFILLMLKGSTMLPLQKDGFTEGTAEECLAFLAQKIGKSAVKK